MCSENFQSFSTFKVGGTFNTSLLQGLISQNHNRYMWQILAFNIDGKLEENKIQSLLNVEI